MYVIWMMPLLVCFFYLCLDPALVILQHTGFPTYLLCLGVCTNSCLTEGVALCF